MRALGIDFGTVRIGVAVSDEKMKLASALTTIEYSKNNYQYVIDKLRLIIKRYEIDLIVLGYPILKDGTKREITLLV
ncbi:MAG: Holliday junction resolvase RuvX, partial [Malacoplasma sp.]|nr:Holliday junction resolvase RuvX [Malacoplasma sp.]